MSASIEVPSCPLCNAPPELLTESWSCSCRKCPLFDVLMDRPAWDAIAALGARETLAVGVDHGGRVRHAAPQRTDATTENNAKVLNDFVIATLRRDKLRDAQSILTANDARQVVLDRMVAPVAGKGDRK